MGVGQETVGPISIREIPLTIPSEISDRGVDGFIDSVFGVNTIYNGDGERAFVMKDGFPAVYYKGQPYGIEDCDGDESVESADGNRYFALADGQTYHCVVEVKKDSPNKGSVKVHVKSGEIEETEGYRIVTNQIICSTPLQDTTKRPSQFHTGTIDSIDDFEGCFEVLLKRNSARSNGAKTYSLSNMYYNVGGKTYQMTPQDISISGGEFVALKVNATGNQPTAAVVKYSDLNALQEAQKDLSYFIRPIYKFDINGAIECDCRKMVSIDMAEFVDDD